MTPTDHIKAAYEALDLLNELQRLKIALMTAQFGEGTPIIKRIWEIENLIDDARRRHRDEIVAWLDTIRVSELLHESNESLGEKEWLDGLGDKNA